MLRTLITLFTLLSTQAYSQSVLVIGDSHTAGPFGSEIHRLLSIEFEQVVTLGHSSSAAYHWVSSKDFKLSGGKFNKMFFNQKQYKDPSPTHWREKVSVPKISAVLKNNAYHAKWRKASNTDLKADLVVIALGANDARVIANSDGQVRTNGYNQRKSAITKLIKEVKASGASCVWIAPPNGIKKTEANQSALYSFLEDSIALECPMMSSNHYKATGCDGVHFSCSSQRPKAIKWAMEAFEFIKKSF